MQGLRDGFFLSPKFPDAPGAFKQGVGMTRKRGTCVLVGLPPGEFPVPLFDVVANCITIRGSFVGTREDMAEIVPCGPDPERHLEAIGKFEDAGYDHVFVHQIGPEQEGFLRFYESELLARV